MEFIYGAKRKEATEISEIKIGKIDRRHSSGGGQHPHHYKAGRSVLRDLRKAQGLIQCVYGEGKTDFGLSSIKEESAARVSKL